MAVGTVITDILVVDTVDTSVDVVETTERLVPVAVAVLCGTVVVVAVVEY